MNRRQLLALGAGAKAIRRALESGRLVPDPDFRGVYAFGHLAGLSQARFIAAVLSCADGAVLTAGAAATNWALLPYRPGDPVDVCSVRWLKPTRARRVHRLRAPLDPRDRWLRNRIPCATVPRLILDLAEIAPADLETALNEAHYIHDLRLHTIQQAAHRAPGRHALKPIAALLNKYDDATTWTRTDLERQLRRITQPAGLPAPSMNHPFRGYEIDAAYPGRKLAIEADGRAAHSTPHHFERDRTKQNALILDGWRVLRFTHNQLHNHPTRVAQQIRDAYDQPFLRNHTHSAMHEASMLPSPST